MAVTVLGAGVIGLTSALVLAERGHRVQLIGAEPPRRTTSATAGAVWGPYRAGPAHQVDRWAAVSLDQFVTLAGRPSTGVRIACGIEVASWPAGPPRWRGQLDGWRYCRPDELPDRMVTGWRYRAPLIDMPVYLDHLSSWVASLGVEVTQRRVASLDGAEFANVVVNCTGLGAGELARDRNLHPVRGEQVVVANPGLTEFFMEDRGSSSDLVGIYPHGDHVVLGGSAVPDSASRDVDQAAVRRIIERCAEFFPALRTAAVLDHRVGVRPVRPTVRIETERLSSGRWCVHNYGHGGAGVTLSWGCARSVADLVAGLAAV
ncbi:MAG: FAD-dependent oxidoreductase [Micromonosporaceae bacterium]